MSDRPNLADAVGMLILLAIVGTITGIYKGLEWVGLNFSPLVIGTADPKGFRLSIAPGWIVATLAVLLIVAGISSWLWFSDRRAISEAQEAWEQKRRQQARLTAEAQQARIAELEAESAQLKASLETEARRADSLPAAERERIKQEVRDELRQDEQDKAERERQEYLRLTDRNRVMQADYEHQQRVRAHRLAQLEQYVIEAWPDHLAEVDPAGRVGHDEVTAKFRKAVAKKHKDAGLLRESRAPDVLEKLGQISGLPESPPPPSPPVLFSIPQKLLTRYGSQ